MFEALQPGRVTEPTVPETPADAPPDADERRVEEFDDEPTLGGPYRVLATTRDREEWLFIDPAGDPTYVPFDGHGDLSARVRGLRPGYRVDAEFDWDDGRPVVREVDVLERSLFAFVPRADPVFEAARTCWQQAREAGEPMNSRVTYTTEGDPAGVVYVFADQPGQRDLFEEFRDGGKPLDPLVDRLADTEEPPFEAFVLDAADGAFVTVYIVVEKDGMVADTVRDTYDLPRPREPLFETDDSGGVPEVPGGDSGSAGVDDDGAGDASDDDADEAAAEFDLSDALGDLPEDAGDG